MRAFNISMPRTARGAATLVLLSSCNVQIRPPALSSPGMATSTVPSSRVRRDQSPRGPLIARNVSALRRAVDNLRSRRATVALVPTMGALHDGHVSLVRLAKRRAAKVLVWIFVNPTQFGPTEGFSSSPRTGTADLAKLTAEKVDLIWYPEVKAMYPDGFATRLAPEGPATV